VRWEWLRRTDMGRPWHGLAMVPEDDAMKTFDILISI
jgi:hypothetical protein